MVTTSYEDSRVITELDLECIQWDKIKPIFRPWREFNEEIRHNGEIVKPSYNLSLDNKDIYLEEFIRIFTNVVQDTEISAKERDMCFRLIPRKLLLELISLHFNVFDIPKEECLYTNEFKQVIYN